MLTKMPKMGDVIIAKDCDEIYFMGDMTPGKEYLVTGLDSDGDAIISDDAFDDRSIYGVRKEAFNLKADEPAGLKEVPKMGDVVIAKNDDEGYLGIADITAGKEYPISKVTCAGTNAWFYDDNDFERIISTKRLEHFTLKETTPDKVGFIEIQTVARTSEEFTKTEVTLVVDSAGYSTIYALVQSSIGERQKSILEEKIAQCQAELNHLNELLAEVPE